jgi:hypothetical protein
MLPLFSVWSLKNNCRQWKSTGGNCYLRLIS